MMKCLLECPSSGGQIIEQIKEQDSFLRAATKSLKAGDLFIFPFFILGQYSLMVYTWEVNIVHGLKCCALEGLNQDDNTPVKLMRTFPFVFCFK